VFGDLPNGSRRLIKLGFDHEGRLIGIEFDGARATLPKSLLQAVASGQAKCRAQNDKSGFSTGDRPQEQTSIRNSVATHAWLGMKSADPLAESASEGAAGG